MYNKKIFLKTYKRKILNLGGIESFWPLNQTLKALVTFEISQRAT